MKFTYITPDKLGKVWHFVEPLLNKAVSLSPEKIAIQDVLEGALHGVYLVWVAIDEENGEFVGAVTTRIIVYPRTKAMALDFVGGSRIKEWIGMGFEAVEEHARRNDCTHLEGYGRKAWERFIQPHGWKQAHITFHKEL